ncbi:MAG: hypothetical protein WDN47_01115 [Candidatus Doudnabacteria bacterium]
MKNPESSLEQPPIIRITEDREVIARKLEEYMGRLDRFKAPEAQFDAIYKIEIIKRLLEKGEVNISDLSKELADKYGVFDANLFDNACKVIEDYATTGGKHAHGGTGLHGDKKTTEDVENDSDDEGNDNGPGRVM